jgi:putative endonuclease
MEINNAHIQTGLEGEEIAANLLLSKGYDILTKNFRHGKGEIDIIAQKGDWLVFVEVRARANADYGFPEQTLSKAKIGLLKRTADAYIHKANWHGPLRFDIIALIFSKPMDVQHFEDVFF